MTAVSLTQSLPQCIAEKIQPSSSGCWLWVGPLGARGYGALKFRGRKGAHRIVWALLKGPIPDGLQLDHLCRVRRCVNPEHLRAVTCAENLHAPGSLSTAAINARKTHCPQGHPYSEENTLWRLRKHRRERNCRACKKANRKTPYAMAYDRERKRRRYWELK